MIARDSETRLRRTGWAGGADTREQMRLTYPTLEAARAYAARNGIDAHIVLPRRAEAQAPGLRRQFPAGYDAVWIRSPAKRL